MPSSVGKSAGMVGSCDVGVCRSWISSAYRNRRGSAERGLTNLAEMTTHQRSPASVWIEASYIQSPGSISMSVSIRIGFGSPIGSPLAIVSPLSVGGPDRTLGSLCA